MKLYFLFLRAAEFSKGLPRMDQSNLVGRRKGVGLEELEDLGSNSCSFSYKMCNLRGVITPQWTFICNMRALYYTKGLSCSTSMTLWKDTSVLESNEFLCSQFLAILT